ncbi:type II secretion system secretin GspD [Undibacterium flavidum]|uniref:Type II secretion system secretin GspD n=1 Tax=Undibacterium flavidum TaxID=2762297 RepID=A0ABR6Y6K3_9BURK|nr:type II secretion system secretin GspD [Undibacterium flavidum]MBC3872254.1 type II secretion system secretin GspD [Undibacterium flavidum]
MKNIINTSTKSKHTIGPKKWLSLAIHAAFIGAIGTVGVVGVVTPHFVFAQEANQNAAGLNFVNADIESVIKAVGHYTGTTFVIDPRVKGQLTLVAEKPLTKDQAFKLLTSNLRMQGFAVVTSDGFSKVVPEADAKLQGGPTQVKSIKGDQIITQVFRVNYEAANNIVTALRPLISPNNVINVNPGNNSIVITDYADNMRRMAEVIALLDVPSNPELEIIPIKHSIAADVATMVTRLSEGNQASADAGRAIVLADSRTNSVLIKAPTVARANLIKALVAKLDQATDLPGNIHVVYLKNAEAVKLAATLRSILSGESSSPSNSSSSNSNSGFGGTSPNNPGAGITQGNNSALSSSGSTLSLPISSNSNSQGQSGGGGGFIQADQATNTLIITASDAVYRNLRGVIDQLDARRAQVYIETIIVEVSEEKSAELGVEWAGATGDSTSNYRLGAVSSNQGNLVNLADPTKRLGALTTGFNIGLFRQIGGQLGIGAIAKAIANDTGSNLLSMPNLVTLDNEEATIVDGQTVGIVTGQYTGATTGAAATNPFQTIERKEIGIKLKVKPQISEGGTVKLSIAQEVSSVAKPVPGSSGITTSLRSIATNVLVEDGQIIALGGLIRDDNTGAEAKVPFLGDIPLIGNLFKYKEKNRKKVNLMVFLRPTVIRNAEDSKNVSLDRYDYLRTQYLRSTENETDIPFLKMEKGRMITPVEAAGADKNKPAKKEGQ